ncbi:PAS domain S-box protein [Acaryochloris sp. IP29b_bin.148]|uniref:PAS domain S-box protein n=1 Tax=Acaryochloris sp. IP29b_bin.148 TaxID=2969218 RepID=UPI00261CC0AE|nr:PAS domain S-box protein [Acaryochloris sp. IP29b_bin.148]
MNHSNVRLPQKLIPKGYAPLELLHEGRYSLVYRALRSADQTTVIIKTTPPQVALRASDHLAFRNQFNIGHDLKHPGIIQVLGLEPCNHSYALIMEDVQGIALSQFLQAAVSLQDGLTIALQLADILQYLSQQQILHKDIKPANILIHPQTLQVKLIDFSIASRLLKETQTIGNPKGLEGTLAYMAPEQTGRMNRGIDFRSDFYSLGVTLFELWSGQLPFQAEEPMAWIHCHIAQEPPSLTGFGVPTTVANIVAKLLAKNAEDRYQSALGLKDDLQRCLTQLTAQGDIERFEVGQNDVCDRILIPEKLYGREADVQILLDAFERVVQGASELRLVAGYSGVGKTAVVNEVHKPILQQEGYFIQGKFDQFNRNIPLSAFVQAFSSLVQQLLSESDADLTQWKAAILTALGNNAQVVIEVIPSLEIILGKQPKAPELSVSAAQNRFNLVFNQFIRVFTQQEHPLVIFLDDLQWADSASLGLLKLLMSESGNHDHSLLVIGAYRDNEVCPAHPLMVCLSEVELDQSSIHTIHLDPLSKANINKLVSDSLLCSEVVARPLSELIYQKTQGNPFFTTQFLQGLYEDNYIAFDREEKCWQCDLSQLKEAALSDDLLAYMATRLHKLPETTQDVLKFAACMGSRFDVATLVVVCEKSELAITDDLWSALQVGLIVPETQIYRLSPEDEVANSSEESSIEYRFLHDRVQQAAYTLIPQSEKAKTHYQIGKLLNQDSSLKNRKTNIFDIVNQFNLGQSLVSLQSERDQLAQLNLIAGTKAKNAIAYQASFDYAHTGLSLLGDNSWDRHYQLTLNLHNLATESAYLKGDFSVLESLVNTINQNAKTILDTVLAVQTQIQFYATQQNYSSAILTGREILQELGIYFPDRPSFEQVKQEYSRFQPCINQFSIQKIEELPLLKEPETLAAAKILLAMCASALISNTNLSWLIILKLVELSLEHGNSLYSAYGYVVYGALVKLIEQDIEKFYQFRQLGLTVVDIFPQNPTKSRVFHVVGSAVSYLKSHLREARPLLSAAYTSGLESGDFEFAGYAIGSKCLNFFFSGELLTTVQTEIIQANQALEQLNNQFAIGLNRFLKQLVAKLTDQLEQPNSLEGNSFNLKEINELLTTAKDRFSLHHCYLHEASLQYLFLNTNLALANIQKSAKNLDSVSGWLTEYIHYFYESLIYLDYIDFANPLEENLVNQYLETVESNQKIYQDLANYAPMNFQHKFDLIEAEKYRILNNKIAALELYDKAIAGAKANQFIQEEALANERAARFYLDWGKDKIAAVYMQEAYCCYERWGAKAKTNDLENRYASLLEPILEQRDGIDPLATLHSIAPLSLSVHSSSRSFQPTTDRFNTVLDLATIFKSAQTLSESIGLSDLLQKLAPMMLQTSGAERLALLLPDADNVWQVKVTATVETTQLVSDPMTDNLHLPVQLLQYVQRTQEALVIDGVSQSLPIVDPYLQDHPHLSVLCLPLLHQTQLIGLLYLEHHSVAGVFSRDRITVLNFLCAQAAIALENALLKQTLEQKLDVQTAKRQASETRLRNMVDNIPGVVYQTRMTGDSADSLSYISPNCQTLYELSAQTLIEGQYSLRDFEHSEDKQSIDQRLAAANQTLQPFNHEFRIITPSGSLKWVQVISRPSRQPDGATHWDGIVMDISDRKQLEQEQNRLIQILQSTTDFIGVCKPENGILWQNQPFRTLRPDLKIHEERVPISRLYPKWAFEIVKQEGLPTAIEQDIWSGETALLTPSGEEIPTSQVIIAHKSEKGEVEYLSTILRDISDRKAAESALKLSEARAKAAFEQAAVGIAENSIEFNQIIQVNNYFCEMLGYTRAEVLQLTIKDVTYPEDLAESKAYLTRLYSGEIDCFTLEKRYVRKDGSIVWAATTVSLINIPGEKAQSSLAIIKDISERKAAELALQETQAQFHRMTENVPGMIYRYVLHPDGQDELTYVSSQMQEIFELDVEVALQNTTQVWDRIHPDDMERISHDIQVSADTLQPFTSSYRLVLPNQGLRWVQNMSHVERLENGDVVWDGVVIDISDRKQLEQEQLQLIQALRDTSEENAQLYTASQKQARNLEESRHRLEQIVLQTPAAVIEWNSDFEFSTWNPAAEKIFGFRAEDAIGQHFSLIVPPNQKVYVDEVATGILTQAGGSHAINENVTKAGKYITCEWFNAPKINADGQVYGGISIALDISERNAKEQELILTKFALDNAATGILWINSEGQLTRVNEAACISLGYGQNALKQRSIWEITPDLQAEDWSEHWATIRSEIYARYETCYQTQDGHIYPVEITSNYLEFDGIGHQFVQFQDISDRKQAEYQLQRVSERLELAAESAQLGIWEWDYQENLLTWNDQMFAIYGVSPQEFEGTYQDWAKGIHPEDFAQVEASTLNSINSQAKSYSQEFRVLHPDGSVRFILATASIERNNQGQPIRLVGMNSDITDRKQAEWQLQVLSERLELAVESAQIGIWEWDHQEDLLAWDDRMFALYGVSPQSFKGTYQDWANSVHPQDLAQLEAHTPDIINGTANRYTQEFRILRPDGSVRFILATAFLERNSQGQPIRSVGINLDITDRKQAEAQLQGTNEELMRATQHKSEFLASMSHELRTPLNAVLGFSQLMQRDRSISDEHHEMLTTINRNGEYLLALINDILEMSKIEAGKVTLNPKPVDLPRFLDDIHETFQVKVAAKNLVFKVTHTSDIPRFIQADEVKLRQILLNLLSNALKFTQEGQISFHTQVLDQSYDTSPEKVHLQFTISDTGPGIASEDLDSIFQAFIQSASGKQHHQGTGLGLPISRNFAQMMEGNLQVSSTLGKGSRFTCDIYAQILAVDPDVEELQSPRYHNIQGLKHPHQSYRLLIVDDNPDNRAVLSQMLSIPGFEVCDAIDGLQAIEITQRWQPHLICMDINMPYMNGLEATRQIRQSGLMPKIIAITANAFAEDHQAALAAGCDDFLAKPFTEDKVFECIACLLEVEFDTISLPCSLSQTSHSASPADLIQEGFGMMPIQWQQQMHQAIRTLDEYSIRQLLAEVPQAYADMVDATSKLLKEFRYDTLMHILEIEP